MCKLWKLGDERNTNDWVFNSQLSPSWIPGDSIKYFEISVPRHIRFAELRKKLFEQPHLTNIYVIGLLKLEIYSKYCGKEEKLLIFFCLSLDDHVLAETRFSLRDKWLFEISECEISRVNCTPNIAHKNIMCCVQHLAPYLDGQGHFMCCVQHLAPYLDGQGHYGSTLSSR